METEDTQQRIVLALRRFGSLRLTTIANKLEMSPSGVSYQLDKMEKAGLIVCTDEKLYRLADTEEIEKAILQVIQGKTISTKQILQAEELRSYEQNKVEALLNKLIITGLLEKVEKRSSGEEPREVAYKLSFLGCRQLGVCYFCNKPVNDRCMAIEGIVSEEIPAYATVDYGLRLHPHCILKWVEGNFDIDYYVQGASCDFCGLPLNANNLISMIGPRNSIEFSELKPYLSSEEEQAVSSHPKPKDGWETVWDISYESKTVEDRSDIEEMVSRIIERAEEWEIKLGEYDKQKRTDQLWTIAAKLIQLNQSKWDIMLKLCGPLLDPLSVIYSQLPTTWAHKLSRYEFFDKSLSEDTKAIEMAIERQWAVPTSFLEGGHAPVIVHGGKQYHIYCYRLGVKLGLLPVEHNESPASGSLQAR